MKKFIFGSIVAFVALGIGVSQLALAQNTNINNGAAPSEPGYVAIPCPPGPDGNLTCGFIGPYYPSSGNVSECSMNGKADYGGGYCMSDGSSGGGQEYVNGVPTGPSGVWWVESSTQGSIPSQGFSSVGDQYNIGFFPNMPVTLSFTGTNGGTATVGDTTASNMSCGCGQNDVNPPTGPKCVNLSASAVGTANPGDPVVLKVVDICKPNPDNDLASTCTGTGCAQWAIGQASVVSTATYCYGKNLLEYFNENGANYQNVADYYPTASNNCEPQAAPEGTIIVNSVDTNGNPVASSWTITGATSMISDSGTGQTYSNEPANVSYTIVPGDAPSGYGTSTVSTDGSPISSGMLMDGDTLTFTIVWQAQLTPVLSAAWTDGSNATSVTIAPGQTSVTVPLQFSNTGASGSVISNTRCGPTGTTPFGLGVTADCQNVQITAP